MRRGNTTARQRRDEPDRWVHLPLHKGVSRHAAQMSNEADSPVTFEAPIYLSDLLVNFLLLAHQCMSAIPPPSHVAVRKLHSAGWWKTVM
jgi:hypothetical protein